VGKSNSQIQERKPKKQRLKDQHPNPKKLLIAFQKSFQIKLMNHPMKQLDKKEGLQPPNLQNQLENQKL